MCYPDLEENLLVLIPNDFEQYPLHSALQDFISDSQNQLNFMIYLISIEP